MAKNKKTSKKKSTKEEQEKLKILSQADQVKGEQLSISSTGKMITVNELKSLAFGNTENPEKKYDIYYKGIQNLLKKHLPKGKENKKARSYVYEEKNVFLTRGKRINKAGLRGADGRMGYMTDAEEALGVVMKWVRTNGTMVDLFNHFRKINIKKGYGTRKDF